MIAQRIEQVGLRLHPDKTKIVFPQDGTRRSSYEYTAFTLSWLYVPAAAQGSGQTGMELQQLPARGQQGGLEKNQCGGAVLRLHRRIGYTFNDLARRVNPIMAGWMHYYGAFYRSALYPFLSGINAYLMGWIRKKYRRLRNTKKARVWWRGVTARYPQMLTHWKWVASLQRA